MTKYLRLPVEPGYDDEALSCLLCGHPKGDINSYLYPERIRCEYAVTYRHGGTTVIAGLHKACWERNGGSA